jgi:hypothetical protein
MIKMCLIEHESSQCLPVNVCRAAPTVEQNAPIIITHLLGQARTATTNCLLILSPNLSLNNDPCVHEARKITLDKSIMNRKINQAKQTSILHMADVVSIAAIVPRGILRLGSRKSPLRFEPAIIPSMKS